MAGIRRNLASLSTSGGPAPGAPRPGPAPRGPAGGARCPRPDQFPVLPSPLPGRGACRALRRRCSGELPPVTKQELMARFDDWVTDPAVTRAGVEAFVADPALVGTPYLGQYFVCTRSGTTGHPGVFVHDPRSVAIYRAAPSASTSLTVAGRAARVPRRGIRRAAVVGTGGHFAGAGWINGRAAAARPAGARTGLSRCSNLCTRLVAALNDFDPSAVTGYPSALELLAEEQHPGGSTCVPRWWSSPASPSVRTAGPPRRGARGRPPQCVRGLRVHAPGPRLSPRLAARQQRLGHPGARRGGLPAHTTGGTVPHGAAEQPRQPGPAADPLRPRRLRAGEDRSL